jgi:hypothetical protein
MYVRFIYGVLLIVSCLVYGQCISQQKTDTLTNQREARKERRMENKNVLASDTTIPKAFVPRKATIRSAIIPGWGQFYNKKYWKIPIVYGALGVSGAVFIFNLKTYRQLKQAVVYRRDTIPGNDDLIAPDLRLLSTETLIFYRNAFRQNIDYSVLAFILIWGLNVVDATVDAHLKGFNISPDLSLKIKPQYQPGGTAGLTLVFQLNRRN